MIQSDLLRSYHQYKLQDDLHYRKISWLKKILLTIYFIVLFFLSLLFSKLFFKKKTLNPTPFIIHYSNIDPHKSIQQELKKRLGFRSIKRSKLFFPVLPTLFIKDIFLSPKLLLSPVFLGALSYKVAQHYHICKRHNISYLFVLQEYSFYMSYLCRILENENSYLLNLMHGIPGPEATFFRFSKCFVWGEYYKKFFINNNAEANQFIITGSIYHNLLKKECTSNIHFDIVYIMQGCHVPDEEIFDVINTLESISKKYSIAIKQHPLYKKELSTQLIDISHNSIRDTLQSTRLIISHFSTTLLDAKMCNIATLSYGPYAELTPFLEERERVTKREELLSTIEILLQSKISNNINYYINTNSDIINTISSELNLLKIQPTQ